MATGVYNHGRYGISTGTINLASDNLRCLIVASAYVFNANHRFINIVAELAGTGYTRKTLAARVVTEDAASNRIVIKCADLVWPGAFFGTPDAAIIYKEGADDLTRQLICSLDLSPKFTTNGGDFTVRINTLGFLVLQ